MAKTRSVPISSRLTLTLTIDEDTLTVALGDQVWQGPTRLLADDEEELRTRLDAWASQLDNYTRAAVINRIVKNFQEMKAEDPPREARLSHENPRRRLG